MQYACIRQTFLGGRPVEVGTVIESASDPGDCFVLASSFSDEGATRVERVATDPGFVVRGENGELIPQAVATRLLGRSLHERKY